MVDAHNGPDGHVYDIHAKMHLEFKHKSFEEFTAFLGREDDPAFALADPEFLKNNSRTILEELKRAAPEVLEPWKTWSMMLFVVAAPDDVFVDAMNFLRHHDNIAWELGLFHGSSLRADKINRFAGILQYVGQEPDEKQSQICANFVELLMMYGRFNINMDSWDMFLDQLQRRPNNIVLPSIKEVLKLVTYVDAMDGTSTSAMVDRALDRFGPLFWSTANSEDIDQLSERWIACYDNIALVRKKSIQAMSDVWNTFWDHPTTPKDVVFGAMVDRDQDVQRTHELLDTMGEGPVPEMLLSKVKDICPQHAKVMSAVLSQSLEGHISAPKAPKKI